VQGSETVLGPIQGVLSPGASASVAADPIEQEQEQEQAEKKSDKKGDGDDSGVDSSLGLINAAPVQLKTDLEQPVTSGGMETMGENPASPD
jgi:hypothetical protein